MNSGLACFRKYCDKIKSGETRVPRCSDDSILDTLFFWRTSMSIKRYYVDYLVDGCNHFPVFDACGHDPIHWPVYAIETEDGVLELYKSAKKQHPSRNIDFQIVYGEAMKVVSEMVVERKLVPAYE